MGGPAFAGASQVTCSLELDTAVTVGANGVSGASLSTSVTRIVMFAASVPPLPSLHPDRHRVARLLLVVQRRARPYLAAVGGRQDVERVRVRTFQGVGQNVSPSRSVAAIGAPTSVFGRVFSATLNVRVPGRRMWGSCSPRPGSASRCPSATIRLCLLHFSPAPAPRSVCPPLDP